MLDNNLCTSITALFEENAKFCFFYKYLRAIVRARPIWNDEKRSFEDKGVCLHYMYVCKTIQNDPE